MPVDYIRSVLIPEARTMLQLARQRLLAGFTNIDAEADQVSNDAWQDYMSQPGDDEGDPGGAAEWAHDLGLERYMALSNLHQATRNLLAVQMWHLFTQQYEDYKRKCERWGEIGYINLWDDDAASSLPSYAAVNELRHVANVAKHAEGDSAKKLKLMRPDLFVNPLLARFDKSIVEGLHLEARAPFAGDGLYVQDDDLDRYEAAVLSLWEEIATAHDEAVRARANARTGGESG